MKKHMIIFICLTAICCSITIAQPIELKEIAYSAKAAQTPFVGIDGMTVSASSVYLVDRVMHRVAVLDVNGLKYRTEFSRSDKPEAALLMPGFIAVTSKYIFVADFGKPTIRIYTPAFEFIRKIAVGGDVFGIAADKDENIWIAAGSMARQQSLKKIDINGKVIAELPLKCATGSPIEMLYTFCIDENNYFYIAYFTKNCIEVAHPTYGFVRQFMVPGLPSTVPWSTMKQGTFSKDLRLPDGIIFSSITTDKQGRLFILTGDYSETPFREVDICSTEGKFISWCNLKEKSHLIHMDKQGHLISVEGNKNKVKVYELKHTSNRQDKDR